MNKVNQTLALFFLAVLTSCSSGAASRLGRSHEIQRLKSASAFSPTMRFEVPAELESAFDDICDQIDGGTYASEIAITGSEEERQALCYLMYGSYDDLYLSRMCLIMADSDPGEYESVAEVVAGDMDGTIVGSAYLNGRDTYIIEMEDPPSDETLAADAAQSIEDYATEVLCPCPDAILEATSVGEPDVQFDPAECWPPLKMSCPEAWKVTKGGGVKVAVFDTGILEGHEEFNDSDPDLNTAGDTWYNLGEDTYNDGNGDVHYQVNFAGGGENPNLPYESPDPESDYYLQEQLTLGGHGTLCCGAVSASDNDVTMIGVAPEAMAVPFKVVTHGGGIILISNVYLAAGQCVIANSEESGMIRAASMSFGWHSDEGGADLPPLGLAIAAMTGANILVVAPDTGNTPGKYPAYPGAYNQVNAAVAGISWADMDDTWQDGTTEEQWDWSTTDLFGYAGWQLGTYYTDRQDDDISGNYMVWEGTSAAAPAIAAIAAMASDANPSLDAADLKQLLLDNARPTHNFGDGSPQFRTADAAFISELPDAFAVEPPNTDYFVADTNGDLIFPVKDPNTGEYLLEVKVFDGNAWTTEQVTQPPGSSSEPTLFAGLKTQPDGTPAVLMSRMTYGLHSAQVWWLESRRGPSGWSNPTVVAFWFTGSTIRPRVVDWQDQQWGSAVILELLDDPKGPFLVIYDSNTNNDPTPFDYRVAMDITAGSLDGALMAVVQNEAGTAFELHTYTPNSGWKEERTLGTSELWSMAGVGDEAGFAYYDVSTLDFGLCTASVSGSSVVFTTSAYEQSELGWEYPNGVPYNLSLTANASGNPYLVLLRAGESSPHSPAPIFAEGIRFDWPTGGNPLLTKETLFDDEALQSPESLTRFFPVISPTGTLFVTDTRDSDETALRTIKYLGRD